MAKDVMRFIIALLIASSAWSDTPMTGAEFEDYVTGRTLSFGTATNPVYGLEQYLPNKQVIWSPQEGICLEGVWYEQGEDICFLYEHDPEPKCWRTYKTDTGLRAEFTNRPGQSPIFETFDEDAALQCPGPDLLG